MQVCVCVCVCVCLSDHILLQRKFERKKHVVKTEE